MSPSSPNSSPCKFAASNTPSVQIARMSPGRKHVSSTSHCQSSNIPNTVAVAQPPRLILIDADEQRRVVVRLGGLEKHAVHTLQCPREVVTDDRRLAAQVRLQVRHQ